MGINMLTISLYITFFKVFNVGYLPDKRDVRKGEGKFKKNSKEQKYHLFVIKAEKFWHNILEQFHD
jgi:hypothetical protein